MTVKQLKQRLELLPDNNMVLITDGIGWTNIDMIQVMGNEVFIVQETEPIFSEN